jgi:hypothetical protein
MSSAAEALDVAQERLRSALSSLRSGERVGGYYPRVPLREPIVDEVLDGSEQLLVVTRNRYGAEILNTDRLLIADIDLPELEAPATGGVLQRLFRRQSADVEPTAEPPAVAERLSALADWARANVLLGVIAYRTASGLRVFVTGLGDHVAATDADRILAELGADPIYRELCRAHGTFRARLTPKPWRLPHMKAPRDRWPVATDDAEQRFGRWLDDYEAARRGYAVCRRLWTHGPAPSAQEEAIIQLHDGRTGVADRLPLA